LCNASYREEDNWKSQTLHVPIKQFVIPQTGSLPYEIAGVEDILFVWQDVFGYFTMLYQLLI
jgi:hypothetical protein